jgi:hypothetical protein
VDRLASRKLKPAPALRLPEIAKKAEAASMWMDDENAGAAVAEVAAAEPSPSVWSAPAVPEKKPASGASFIAPEPPAGAAADAERRLAGPLADMSSGDERREEARRFARLLVSEIKLYNERAVLEGREHSNLYERLHDDIDRSRQMYEERIPQDVRSSSNFFQEELVLILAEGRPEVLGL